MQAGLAGAVSVYVKIVVRKALDWISRTYMYVQGMYRAVVRIRTCISRYL